MALSVVLALLLGCSNGTGAGATTSTAPPSGSSDTPTSPTAPTSSAAATSAPTAHSPTNTAAPSPRDPIRACAASTLADLGREQRIGQLLMVGLDTNAAPSSLDAVIAGSHVGNVVYLGGWSGATTVAAASRHLQQQASTSATGGVPMLVAADQEGGVVQQLRGDGFTRIPPALTQGTWSRSRLTSQASEWAGELRAVGVNVNLAPVADTVPERIGKANAPIGKWGRQFGSDPKAVSRSVSAFVEGMRAGGIEPTLKHFPGLGRVRSNTDFDSTGITDDVATVTDPLLAPFAAGVDDGAGLVMVGSARYPKIDARNRALFSRAVVSDLLRERLGFTGVAITDDVNAEAVRDVPAAERAVRFVAVGGDVVLTGDPTVVPAMARAVADKAEAEPAYAATVDAAATRVLALKARMGLLPCSP